MQPNPESPNCPICGKPMEKKEAEKQALAEPYLGPAFIKIECADCAHVEGKHKNQ